MKLEKLAEKAREELDYHATKILERDFDDQNVALFLIYGRDALEKDTALLDFATPWPTRGPTATSSSKPQIGQTS